MLELLLLPPLLLEEEESSLFDVEFELELDELVVLVAFETVSYKEYFEDLGPLTLLSVRVIAILYVPDFVGENVIDDES